MIAQHLSRWAEQWIIYMTSEFGFIKIADRYTTSSSMMPQKRNPDMLELIRGRCGNVYGDLFALMTILKGLPIGYNRDLQEDKRIVFRAYDTVSSCLTMAAAIVNSASYDKERIEPTLDRGFLDATSLAEYLVTKGTRESRRCLSARTFTTKSIYRWTASYLPRAPDGSAGSPSTSEYARPEGNALPSSNGSGVCSVQNLPDGFASRSCRWSVAEERIILRRHVGAV